MSVHVFGIRHHGPGSAHSLSKALEELRPDAVLVEGPPDAQDVLHLLGHQEMMPPVAILVYRPDLPHRAVFYPFAFFSPEWQAIRYGLNNGIQVRFMDLPLAHRFAEENAQKGDQAPLESTRPPANPDGENLLASPIPGPEALREDPLAILAKAAGFNDGERWWEHMVEHRRNASDIFKAIQEAMAALRDEFPGSTDLIEVRREAYMRQTIREAVRDGFERVAVVCGAWHAPVLAKMPSPKDDAFLLKSLPKVKTQATWTPWTNGRLTMASGYGAGIQSPGWYAHLWYAAKDGLTPSEVAIHWMTRVARLFREEDMDASPAQVIDAVRLATSLAAFRNRPIPGLDELNEASLSVFCFGSILPMSLIYERLIVGETLGSIPDETPMAPLQTDLLKEQKRLRLPAEASQRILDLDLRKPIDLDRSRLLHRLNLLKVAWGAKENVRGKGGTFHELWRIQWDPSFTVALIEAGAWGNTIFVAAEARIRHQAAQLNDLPDLTRVLDAAILADLPGAVSHLMVHLESEAALACDISHLMDALPPLANVQRYGNVRGTDERLLGRVINGMVARICIGLPGACASLNQEAAEDMLQRLIRTHSTILLLRDDDHTTSWQRVLYQLAKQQGVHGLISGRCCKLLLESGACDIEEISRWMSLALSRANDPSDAAAWVEGFLKGSGLLLLHDDILWNILDAWLAELQPEVFTEMLPLLRRTFAEFPYHERRQMGEKACRNSARIPFHTGASGEFDIARAEAILPLVSSLLGLGL